MRTRPIQVPGLLNTSLHRQWPRSICPQCLNRYSWSQDLPVRSSIVFPTSQNRPQSSWATAVQAAQTYFNNGKNEGNALPGGVVIDPLRTVAKEMKFLKKNIRQLIGSTHPVLHTVSQYYTQAEGKHIRPMLVLLMSQATALTPKNTSSPQYSTSNTIDLPISPPGILCDENPLAPQNNSFPSILNEDINERESFQASHILPSQRRLAEITELIHTASLLHDDVIDHSTSRRNAPSANVEFGNKMAVLAGDFLLGRASVALARLRDPQVTELLATVIANLIEGEFMQLKNTVLDERMPVWKEETITYYLQKTYLKSASLISKSCRAAALLGQAVPEVVDAAYSYGKNLGLAFQLVDDMLDYTSTDKELGKPSSADLELGLATAPLLFAWKSNEELGELVGRKFGISGDVQRARDLVMASDGIEQTRALAQEYADKAEDAISGFPPSDAKNALIETCAKVMKRKK